MVQPIWKLISLLLALSVFIAVGAVLLCKGEELIWAVLKSIGAFVICWIILAQLGNMLNMILEKQEDRG